MVAGSYHKEVIRKVIHVSGLGYLAVYFIFAAWLGHRAALLVLAGLLLIAVFLEYVRLKLKLNIPLLKYLYNFRRRSEADRLGAEVYFLLGVLISLAMFDTAVAVAAVLMTVFGDMAAALVGMKLGRIRPKAFGGEKSLEGAAAGLLVNFAVGLLYLRTAGLEGLGGQMLWPVVVAMALTASVVELTIPRIDDNLTIPVLSGCAGQLTVMLLSG